MNTELRQMIGYGLILVFYTFFVLTISKFLETSDDDEDY